MKVHLNDPIERSESLARPAAISIACHAGLFAAVMLWSLIIPPPFQFGDPEGDAGSAVTVNVVDGIPIDVPRAERNPVANPVEHEVPAPTELQRTTPPETPKEPEPEAVPVEVDRKPTERRREYTQGQRAEKERKEHEIASSTGRRTSSDIFSGEQKSGMGVGLQGANPFGQGYAGYAAALQRRVSEEWTKALGQASGTTSKPIVVRFRIQRDGRIDQIRVMESSGNRSLDTSAHRAVVNVNPFQPLPPGLRRPYIIVEMRFQLSS